MVLIAAHFLKSSERNKKSERAQRKLRWRLSFALPCTELTLKPLFAYFAFLLVTTLLVRSISLKASKSIIVRVCVCARVRVLCIV